MLRSQRELIVCLLLASDETVQHPAFSPIDHNYSLKFPRTTFLPALSYINVVSFNFSSLGSRAEEGIKYSFNHTL